MKKKYVDPVAVLEDLFFGDNSLDAELDEVTSGDENDFELDF